MIKLITSEPVLHWLFERGQYPETLPDDFPVASCGHVVLGVYEPDLIGCFPVEFHESKAEIHACFLPERRGYKAIAAAKEAFRWVFENTQYTTIISRISERHVKHFAIQCGMVKRGDHYEVSHGRIC